MVGLWWSKLFQRYIVSKITLGHGWPILQAGHDELTQRDTFLQHKTKSKLAANDSLKSMDWSKVSLFYQHKIMSRLDGNYFQGKFQVTGDISRPGWIDPKTLFWRHKLMSTLGDDYSQALKAGAGGLQSRSELDLTANAIKIMKKLLLISLLGTAVVVISGKHKSCKS